MIYTISLDPMDSSGYAVEMRVRNRPDTLRLALAADPEYPGRFWRNVRNITASANGYAIPVLREDSAVWRVVAVSHGDVVIRYRVSVPAASSGNRGSWTSALGQDGALIRGHQTFFFIIGHTAAPALVRIVAPPEWDVATGLPPTSCPREFSAESFEVLVDTPIMLGRLRTWRFDIDRVPHRVVYWPWINTVPFDTTAFVGSVERIAREAVAIFGRPPYADYTFLYQDGAYGALEHTNSVTIGAQSVGLARDPLSEAGSTAHEFFHTWNLVRLRPRGYGGIVYRPPPPTTGLWWSEGVTMYFAQAMLLRAGLESDSVVQEHLAERMAQYLDNPGNSRISPEHASYTAGEPSSGDAGYTADYYAQGQLIGAILDIVIRDSTQLRRGMDDVMRAMFASYAGGPGFTGADIERTASDVCACNLHDFFERHVRNAEPLQLDRYLSRVGLRAIITREVVTDSAGHERPDLRVFARIPEDSARLQLVIPDPTSAWGRAGLVTGDEPVAIDSTPVTSVRSFRTVLSRIRVGDHVSVEYRRHRDPRSVTVQVSGYKETHVKIEDLQRVTPEQRAARALWMRGRQRDERSLDYDSGSDERIRLRAHHQTTAARI
ncbi:MAG: PDZ domain-containing protein [Gemmatimonadaceae bacterium]